MVSIRTLTASVIFAGLAVAQTLGLPDGSVRGNSFLPPSLPQNTIAESPRKLTPEQRGDVFMARKMFREAIDAYLEGPKDSAVTWNKVGIAYHQLGDLAAARRNYEKAMRVDGKYPDAVNNLGTIFYAQKKFRPAISRYRKAIGMSPNSASFWSNLGTAYYSRGKYEDMAASYEKALSLDPMVFEHRGTVGTELQDRSVADRARYHYEMARMYAHAGKFELALQNLRKSLEEGLKDREKMTQAPEFAAMRDTEEFKLLLATEPRVL